MVDTGKLEITLNEQQEFYKNKTAGIQRDNNLLPYIKTRQITIISGIRRSGKSTLMLQIAQQFNDYHFVNFDDERLVNFTVEDFQVMMMLLHKRSESKNVFFDEIQNVPQWERFVRRIHDLGYKIYITGSNARLLSSELATHLTGRYLKLELYPFSFSEYLSLNKIEYQRLTTTKMAKLLLGFDEYLNYGGFPEWLVSNNKEVLQRTYEDIIYRDVIVRYRINEVKAFKQLSQYLMTNVAKEFTYQSLARNLGFKSQTSPKNYVEFLGSVYVFFELFKYDFSLKKQFVSNKKIYAIDNGLRNIVGFKFSSDAGRLLENIVFIELLRRKKNVFYFKNKNECDFILEHAGQITTAIQVCYQPSQDNLDRELDGLLEAISMFNLDEGYIISYNFEEQRQLGGVTIKIIPAWKWLLDEKS